MDVIRERIDQTVASLKEKKAILERHKAQYNDLKFKLMDFQQYKESDKPAVDVKLNSKAIVKGQIINPKKILVFLGAEYFVEREPSKAIKSVESKLKFLNKAIGEFETKIKEAKKTIENIGHLEEYEKKKENKDKKQDESTIVEETGDFPFMDIREELDEDGNVISSTIKQQDDSGINGFAENDTKSLEQSYDDQIAELLEDMEIRPRPRIEEISEEKTQLKKDVVEKVDSDEVMEEKLTEKEIVLEREPVKEETAPTPKSSSDDDYYELLKQMGITSLVDQPKEDKDIVTPKEEEPKEAEKISESAQPVIEVNDEWDNVGDQEPAIDQDDILQLQLIADEFEEDGDYEYDDEIEFDEEEDDDDEDDEDWDFTTKPDSLIPGSHRNLFMKELDRVRAEKAKNDKPVNNMDEPVETGAKQKMKKKSVSFAPELQIKQIENISEELKNAPDGSKVSKFKQMRLHNNQIPNSRNGEFSSLTEEVEERPLSDIVVEKDIIEQEVPLVNPSFATDIIDKEEPLQPQPKPRISKFKQRNGSSSIVSPPIPAPDSESITSDIVEKDEIKKPETPKAKVSKFKQKASSSEINETSITAAGALNDIVEKEDIFDSKPPIMEPNTPEVKKTSHFKSNRRQAEPKGNVISIPSVESDYVPQQEDEYENIRAYVVNDEEDEEALNSVTDMDIYTTNDIDEDEDDFDDEEEEKEEDPNDRNVLTDQVVERDEVEDPSYYVDDNLLQKEYQDLRQKMFAKYMERENGAETTEKIIYREQEEQELEPIDEHGNPVKVSRFRESLGK